ncbi:zinc finger protein 271 isoform X1 [Coregonus clupeaformis]|uniref:zinc finger protein 271 isoform X1 n=1 Tax=Coregonus clupeaformis TaxID=59861 RepID=UPI001E1C7D3C|nr:zinc finger protein 271 isoform X1 [Coregonus clupeaformis]
MKGKSGDAASGIQPQILTTLSWLSGFIKHKETESNYPKAEEMDTPEDLQEDNLIEQEHFHSSNNEKQDGHLAVRRNVILERTKFNQRQQEAGETADDFITALHCLSEHCSYGALLSEMIRDRLVAGLRDRRLSKQLQMDPELTLDKAVTRIRQTELVEKQQDLLEHTFKAASSVANVDSVLSYSKHPCPANVQCQSEKKNQNSERPQQPQTTQDNAEEPLDTDDFIEDFSPGGEKPHYCAYCGRSFQKVRDLIRHQRTHTGEKPHHCPDCDRSFARLDKLKLHKRTHTGEKPHHCPDCDRSFARLDKLKIHQEIHIGVKPHRCPDCDRSFARLDKLKSHQKIHAKDKRIFHSSDCVKSFVLLEKLEKHQLENTFKATSSAANVDRVLTQQKTFNKVKESKRQQSKIRARAPGKGTPSHSKTMQEKEEEPLDTDDSDEWIDGFSPGGEKPHYCFDCGKSFRKVGDLIRHQRTHTGEKPHHCPVCDRSFARLDKLKLHQEIHTGVKPHHCPDCEKSFARLDKLKLHQKTHMKEECNFHCSDCVKSFVRLKQLEKHQLRHKKSVERHTTHLSKRKTFLCTICGKECRNMKIHMRVHTGETPYHCTECGKSFSYTQSYQRHILTHNTSGERATYPCLECGKTFTRRDGMARHMRRIHTGERNHQCRDCGKLFFKKGTLKRHMLVHTGEKPYQCSVCGQPFSQDGDRKRHEKRHYSGVSDFLNL